MQSQIEFGSIDKANVGWMAGLTIQIQSIRETKMPNPPA
jgi:hypothetical protein